MEDSTKRRQTLGVLYERAFHPDVYVETYYGQLDKEVEFFMRNLHNFFSEPEAANGKDVVPLFLMTLISI